MAVHTIGTGGDFSMPALWEADIPATLTEQRIGELLKQEFTGTGNVLDIDSHTTTATLNIVVRCAAGAGFKDAADAATNPLRYDATKGAAIYATGGNNACAIRANGTSFVEINGIQAKSGGNYASRAIYVTGANARVVNCICELENGNNTAAALRIESSNAKAINCAAILRSGVQPGTPGMALSAVGSGGGVFNCTVVRPSDLPASTATGIGGSYSTAAIIRNTAVFGFNAATGSFSASSGNNCTDKASIVGSSNQVAKVYASQFQDTGDTTRDFRLKADADCIDNGASDSVNAATDIIGTARPNGAGYDIGCWEFVASGGGTIVSGSVGEAVTVVSSTIGGNVLMAMLADAWTLSDTTTPRAALFPGIVEALSVADAAAGPAGTTSDLLSESLDLSDAYAGSALWTVMAAASGVWSPVATGTPIWTPIDPSTFNWIKH